MFVMNFGAVHDQENGDWSFIPDNAITSNDGFPGAGMPNLWLLNANEGSGYPYRVINFLWKSYHQREVYAAIVVPGVVRGYSDADNDGQPDDVNSDVESKSLKEGRAMKVKYIVGIGVTIVGILGVTMSGWGQKHKATPEITEQLKKAYAHYCQDQYEQSLALALPLYQKDPEIWAAWWPKWLYRVAKGPIPSPYEKSKIMRMTIESYEAGRPFNLSTYVKTANARRLTADSYLALGRYQEALPIYEEMQRRVGNAPASVPDKAGLCRRLIAQGYRPPQPPAKSTWKPLNLRFREEDYFVLVPLDEACKVLGLSCSIAPNPKMAGGKGIRISKPDMPNVVWRLFLGHPLVERLENGKGRTEMLAYAPYEEDEKVWVPFYWLARQVGIRWWEVRNGKIYVAPKQPRERLNPP